MAKGLCKEYLVEVPSAEFNSRNGSGFTLWPLQKSLRNAKAQHSEVWECYLKLTESGTKTDSDNRFRDGTA